MRTTQLFTAAVMVTLLAALSGCASTAPAGAGADLAASSVIPAAGPAAHPTALPTTPAGETISRPTPGSPAPESSATTVRTTRFIVADWPLFDTVDALVDSSSLVVVARVTKVDPSTQGPDEPGTPPNKKGNGSVSTVFHFSVEQVIVHRDGPEPAGSVSVNSGNGTVDGVRWVIGGEPAYREGDRYLLFLKWSPSGPVYSDAGGAQAAYTIDAKGRLSSLHDSYLHSPVMNVINGRTLADVITLVRTAPR